MHSEGSLIVDLGIEARRGGGSFRRRRHLREKGAMFFRCVKKPRIRVRGCMGMPWEVEKEDYGLPRLYSAFSVFDEFFEGDVIIGVGRIGIIFLLAILPMTWLMSWEDSRSTSSMTKTMATPLALAYFSMESLILR